MSVRTTIPAALTLAAAGAPALTHPAVGAAPARNLHPQKLQPHPRCPHLQALSMHAHLVRGPSQQCANLVLVDALVVCALLCKSERGGEDRMHTKNPTGRCYKFSAGPKLLQQTIFPEPATRLITKDPPHLFRALHSCHTKKQQPKQVDLEPPLPPPKKNNTASPLLRCKAHGMRCTHLHVLLHAPQQDRLQHLLELCHLALRRAACRAIAKALLELVPRGVRFRVEQVEDGEEFGEVVLHWRASQQQLPPDLQVLDRGARRRVDALELVRLVEDGGAEHKLFKKEAVLEQRLIRHQDGLRLCTHQMQASRAVWEEEGKKGGKVCNVDMGFGGLGCGHCEANGGWLKSQINNSVWLGSPTINSVWLEAPPSNSVWLNSSTSNSVRTMHTLAQAKQG
eukprot:366086-Chlamydomonas_euryale.AAC.12